MSIPRILLTAGASGSGKTLLTCGILQCLKNRGLTVASFKCGPDYIDPMFHSKVIHTKSSNLDTFMMSKDRTAQVFADNSRGCDIAVIEGVMGYYDGVAGISTQASAYDVASVTDTPVILLVNCKGMSVSVVPFIQGFMQYRKDSWIQGVILNRISPMLYDRLKTLIEEQLEVRVLGYLPEVTEGVLQSRHLGLVLPQEIEELQDNLQLLAQRLEQTLEMDQIIELAGTAPELTAASQTTDEPNVESKLRIAVAKDEAFCFFYQDNFKMLERLGAELVFFSPIHDTVLPDAISGILLYGGYPELYAKELARNVPMKEAIAACLAQGMPCMAECGGFMYLHERMQDMQDTYYPMVGSIQGDVYRTDKLSRFGYLTLESETARVFGQTIGAIPGHEFHYFDSTNCGSDFTAYKPMSSRSWSCMHSTESLFCGFAHIHYDGNPRLPEVFLQAAAAFHLRINH
ncbi:MAG: cobyrinate a,c-diamide synthase [Lachnospiraceae bacterium]